MKRKIKLGAMILAFTMVLGVTASAKPITPKIIDPCRIIDPC